MTKRNPFNKMIKKTACLVAVLFALLVPSYGFANSDMIQITLGKADVLSLPAGVSDVMVADPKIADVSALQLDKLYMVGTALGDTNIMVLDGRGNVLKNFNIHVGIDTDIIDHLIKSVFPGEKSVRVQVVGGQVALTGSVSTPAVAQKIARLVAAHVSEIRGGTITPATDSVIQNLMEVRGEQQVTLRVRILEVSRNVLKELGVETSTTGATSTTGLRPSSTVSTKTGLTKDPFAVTSLLFNSGFGTIGNVQLLLNALEQDNLGNILAEPNLTAVSGEQAGFLAGGEFPIPTGRDQYGNITIDYKKFGVSLNFKPIVLSADRISLQLDTEVSSLNQGQGITLSGITVPGLDVRRASTTVEMNSGGSLMMAGLLKSGNVKGMSGLPGIKDTPVLGDLVSSKSFARDETELVVIVTPYLAQPYADTTQVSPVSEEDLGLNLPPPPPTAAMTPPDKGRPQALYSKDEAKKMHDDLVSDKKPVQNASPAANVFGNNMRKIYGDRIKNIPKDNKQAFGYMID